MAKAPGRALVPVDPPKRGRGRPSKFTPALAAEIVERLAAGEFLTVICRGDHMPNPATVYAWMAANDAFSQDVARARQIGCQKVLEEVVEIADTPLMFEEVSEEAGTNDKGAWVKQRRDRKEALGHRRLQIETRLKYLAIVDPARFGGKPEEKKGDEDADAVKIVGGLPEE